MKHLGRTLMLAAIGIALAAPTAVPVSARVPGGHAPGGHGPGGHGPGGHGPGPGHSPGHAPPGHAIARGHGVTERALTMRPQPAVVPDEATTACQRRFKSYDLASKTYLGRDRRRHACP